MCETCTISKPKQTLTIYGRQFDPTRTTTLRNMFEQEMVRRFKKIVKSITEAIVTQDVFGLADNPILVQATPSPQAFNFPRSADKVTGFMQWLQQLIDQELLTVTRMPQLGVATEQAWTDMYIQDSYKRGVMRGRSELVKAGYSHPGMQFGDTVEQALMNPFHMDRVGLLYTRTYQDLKGITDAMSNQISRVLSQGMMDGDGPALLARKMRAVIEGGGADLGITDALGRYIPAQRRARMLARTESIRAHHKANMQEYRNWGAVGVKVQVEWITAEDGRVCEQCLQMSMGGDNGVYTLEAAEDLIPYHPNCRCMMLPQEISNKT